MFETILVGIDGADGGRDALALGRALASATRARLVLATIYPGEHAVARELKPGVRRELRDDAQDMLERERAQAGAEADLVAEPDGSAARGLHRVAGRERADLIVVGACRRGPLGRVFIGDDAAATLHGAPCAVAVAVRGQAERPGELKHVGAGFDGSADSRRALETAADLARASGAALHVLSAVPEPRPISTPYSLGYAYDLPKLTEGLVRDRRKLLDAALDDLGVPAEGETVVDEPRRALERRSASLDLLVLGSRGYGPVLSVLLGSTSDHLVRHAACPVLVTPRVEAAEGEEAGAPAEAASA